MHQKVVSKDPLLLLNVLRGVSLGHQPHCCHSLPTRPLLTWTGPIDVVAICSSQRDRRICQGTCVLTRDSQALQNNYTMILF